MISRHTKILFTKEVDVHDNSHTFKFFTNTSRGKKLFMRGGKKLLRPSTMSYIWNIRTEKESWFGFHDASSSVMTFDYTSFFPHIQKFFTPLILFSKSFSIVQPMTTLHIKTFQTTFWSNLWRHRNYIFKSKYEWKRGWRSYLLLKKIESVNILRQNLSVQI